MSSFFDLGAQERLGKENKLLKLSNLIDWKRIKKILDKVHLRDENEKASGGFSYDKLKMFKAVLLGQWHSLSDPGLEEALRVRLDFMHFTGFSLDQEIPDETTLCRFRNKLAARGLDKKLLIEINFQLELLGLKLEKAPAAVIDATIIESAARPRRTLEIFEDRAEEASTVNVNEEYIQKESCDTDAKWLKKGRKSYYGYKGFVATDGDGYINHVHVTPANKSETKELANILPSIKAIRVLADKGYCSAENRATLKDRGFKDGLMHKAFKNKPLSKWQKLFNKMISKTRYIIEQGFGTLKRKFKIGRATYIGLDKVSAQLIFKAMCFNLLKAVNKVQIV